MTREEGNQELLLSSRPLPGYFALAWAAMKPIRGENAMRKPSRKTGLRNFLVEWLSAGQLFKQLVHIGGADPFEQCVIYKLQIFVRNVDECRRISWLMGMKCWCFFWTLSLFCFCLVPVGFGLICGLLVSVV